MTDPVREMVWRRPRRMAAQFRDNWCWNVIGTAIPRNFQEGDDRIQQVQSHLITWLMGRFPWFDVVDMLNPQPDRAIFSWFVGAAINVLDLNGKPMKYVQRVCPDTRRCEVRHVTTQGGEHSINYYEVTCGGVAWFPVAGTREQVLESLPERYHQYVAQEDLCECDAKKFAQMCIERQNGSS